MGTTENTEGTERKPNVVLLLSMVSSVESKMAAKFNYGHSRSMFSLDFFLRALRVLRGSEIGFI
jgi:hypothetical protein